MEPSTDRPSRLRRAVSLVLSAYLVLFLCDGTCSVIDDALRITIGFHGLAGVRSLIAHLCYRSGLLLLALSIFTPLLRKSLLVPAVGFLIVCSLGIVESFFPTQAHRWVLLALSVGQLLLGAAMLWRAQKKWLSPWPIIPPEGIGQRAFTWRNLAGSCALLFLVGMPLFSVLLIVSVASEIERLSGHFIQFHWNRMEMQAGEYQRADGKIVYLIPMMHVGDADFYSQISAFIPPTATVLLEGVRDEKKALPEGLSYAPLAASLGVVTQHQDFSPQAARMQNADVDLSTFSPQTLALIKRIARLEGHLNVAEFQAYKKDVREWRQRDPQLWTRFFNEIILGRNQHLLGVLDDELQRTDIIVLAWGAIHMPGLEQGLVKRGFHRIGTREFSAIHFRPAARALWDRAHPASAKL